MIDKPDKPTHAESRARLWSTADEMEAVNKMLAMVKEGPP